MIERAEINRAPLVLAVGLGGLIAAVLLLQPALDGWLVLGAAVAFVVAFLDRRVGIYLMVPAMALSPDIHVSGIPARAEDLLMVPLAAGWLAHMCVFKDRQRTALDRLVAAYFLVGAAATGLGFYMGTSQFTFVKDWSAPFHLLKRLEFVLLFFIMTDSLRTRLDVRRLSYVLLASMLALNIYSLQQFAVNRFMASGPLGVTGHEAGVASMIAVPLAISLIPASPPPLKAFLAGITVFSLAVLPLSLGRNFLVVTGFILLYVGLFRQRWVLLVPVLFLLASPLYPPHVLERIFSLRDVLRHDVVTEFEGGTGIGFRLAPPLYHAGIAAGYSPLLGFGLASEQLGAIDSEYGVQMFYTGLAGLVIFLLLGARAFMMTKETVSRARDPFDADLARGFQLVLIAYAIFSLFSASVSPTHTGGFFFIVVSLIAVLHRAIVGSPVETHGDPPRGGLPTQAGTRWRP